MSEWIRHNHNFTLIYLAAVSNQFTAVFIFHTNWLFVSCGDIHLYTPAGINPESFLL